MSTDFIKTPVGTLKFGSLFEKDKYGKFSCGIEFDIDQFKEIGLLLKDMQAAFVKLNPKLIPFAFYSPSKDEDGNSLPGKILVAFKSAFGIHVVDSLGKKVSQVNIGNGSKVRVQFKPVPQESQGKAYIAKYVNALQIIELVEFDPNPFGSYEGGYVMEGSSLLKEELGESVPFNDDIPF